MSLPLPRSWRAEVRSGSDPRSNRGRAGRDPCPTRREGAQWRSVPARGERAGSRGRSEGQGSGWPQLRGPMAAASQPLGRGGFPVRVTRLLWRARETGRWWDLGSTPPSASVNEGDRGWGPPRTPLRGMQRPGDPPARRAAGWLVPFRRHLSAAPRISHRLAQGFGAGGRSGPRRELCTEDVRANRRGGATRGAGPSAVRGGFPRLWREAHSPPRPLLAGYLDAAAQSWDLTFLRLRRPRDPRQGALRASAGRGREDAKGCDCPG